MGDALPFLDGVLGSGATVLVFGAWPVAAYTVLLMATSVWCVVALARQGDR
ncbi:hypothetical protein ACFVWN_01135 [Nocardiopsis flavescens]|uniref:hypothetical protein n=1 Tax=Nocardiopsis flavescens TaxID=758803 RepID=UPI0036654775